MPTKLALPSLIAAALTLAFASGCSATSDSIEGDEDSGSLTDGVMQNTHTLWVHGKDKKSRGQIGNYDDFAYWGDPTVGAGIDKKAVNWGGVDRIAETSIFIRNALDCYCTGKQWCYLAGHSAGDVQIGYALAMFGGGERPVTDGIPDDSGRCGETGETQIGWNVYDVAIAGGAGGGSELADNGTWWDKSPVMADLQTVPARALYDHSATQGLWFHRFVGAYGGFGSGFLPGEDDGVVAYHSTGGLSEIGSYCNPGNDKGCDDTLELGDAPTPKLGIAKWDHHLVDLRDDAVEFDHVTSQRWGGIVAPVVSYMAGHAVAAGATDEEQ